VSDVLPITLYGNPILRQRCREVVDFDAGLHELIDAMGATQAATDHGVGLAANQVGRSERVFVFDFGDGRAGHVVNPVVSPVGSELQDGHEACLSLPGFGLPTGRAERCVVRGLTREAVGVAYEGEGLAARCFQHEVDHLNGLLYIDRHPAGVRRRLEAEARAAPWFGCSALDPRSPGYLGTAEP
jgi:peptide deformylase